MKKFYYTLNTSDRKLWEAIDSKVRKIVFTIINKGYTTVSSCEGHDILQNRLITILFSNLEDASKFSSEINNLRIPWLGTKIEFDMDFFNTEGPNGEALKVPRKELTNWLSSLIKEYADSFYVVEISIGEIKTEEMNFISEAAMKIYKRLFLSFHTWMANRILRSKLITYSELKILT